MSAAGKRDRWIVIQRAVTAPDAAGQPIAVWVDAVRTWASYSPIPMSVTQAEVFKGQQYAAFGDSRFVTAYRRDVTITPLMRLLHDGRIYNIVRVSEIGRRVDLQIDAYARTEAA